MEIVRKYVPIIVLTIILVIVWVGILVFSKKSLSTINPKVEEYTAPLNSSFDEEVLNDVSKRIDDTYAIPPSSFFDMVNTEESAN
jgi:uncharacterized membrane protein YkgB